MEREKRIGASLRKFPGSWNVENLVNGSRLGDCMHRLASREIHWPLHPLIRPEDAAGSPESHPRSLETGVSPETAQATWAIRLRPSDLARRSAASARCRPASA